MRKEVHERSSRWKLGIKPCDVRGFNERGTFALKRRMNLEQTISHGFIYAQEYRHHGGDLELSKDRRLVVQMEQCRSGDKVAKGEQMSLPGCQ